MKSLLLLLTKSLTRENFVSQTDLFLLLLLLLLLLLFRFRFLAY